MHHYRLNTWRYHERSSATLRSPFATCPPVPLSSLAYKYAAFLPPFSHLFLFSLKISPSLKTLPQSNLLRFHCLITLLLTCLTIPPPSKSHILPCLNLPPKTLTSRPPPPLKIHTSPPHLPRTLYPLPRGLGLRITLRPPPLPPRPCSDSRYACFAHVGCPPRQRHSRELSSPRRHYINYD